MTKRRAARRSAPVYLRVRNLVDPDTGELVRAFVAAHVTDKRVCKERKYRNGDELRAELKKPRNPKFHRLVMGALQLVLDNQEGLHTIDQLLTIVKIKLGRVETTIDPSSGKVFYIPESISFDALDESGFHEFWSDLCRLICRDYLPSLRPDQVEDMALMMGEAA